MAKPPRLEKLKHGRLLSGKVFCFFVETWNWLVGAFDNMRGDADINPNEGMITVDRTDPDNPVIRFVGKMPNNQSGNYLCEGVESLNKIKGDIEVIGGNEIKVTTQGQKIIISYEKDYTGDEPEDYPEEDPEEDPEYDDPCEHDPAGDAAGVKPDDGAGPGANGNNDPAAGGVPAQGGEEHLGDNNCNCP